MSSKVNLFLSAETIVVWVWCCAVSIAQCLLIFWLTLFGDQTLPQHQGTNTSLLNNHFGIHHTTIHGAPIQMACSSVFSTLFHVMWDLKASVLFNEADNTIHWTNLYPWDNAIGFPSLHISAG